MTGDVGADELFDHVEQLGRGPEARQLRPEPAVDVNQHRRALVLFLERGQAMEEIEASVLVLDLAGGVEAFGQVVDDAVDLTHHRLEIVGRQKILGDEKTVLEILFDLGLGQNHRFRSHASFLARFGADDAPGQTLWKRFYPGFVMGGQRRSGANLLRK